MNELAESGGFLVVYPEQSAKANGQRCWNWFKADDQRREMGEPSIIAGITRQIAATQPVDTRRIYVAGMPAGDGHGHGCDLPRPVRRRRRPLGAGIRGGARYAFRLHSDEAGSGRRCAWARSQAERWIVHGAGHAWSGGSQRSSYTDPHGPDASAEMVRFFLEHPRG